MIIFIQIYDKSLFYDKSDNFQTKVINYMTKVLLLKKNVTKVIISLMVKLVNFDCEFGKMFSI